MLIKVGIVVGGPKVFRLLRGMLSTDRMKFRLGTGNQRGAFLLGGGIAPA